MDFIYHYDSPLGGMTLSSDGSGLTGLWFDGQKYFASTLGAEYQIKNLPVFDETGRWLDMYFQGKAPDFIPDLHLNTTVFRKAVWNILLTIPFGHTMTYGEIAARIAKQCEVPRISARAVGNAAGHNPITLIIPCHRVIGNRGSLTGYAGGLERKAKLLELEQITIKA